MQPTRRNTFLAAALIVLVGAAAYANSFDTPFVFDDIQYVAGNPDIRALWPPDWLAKVPTRALAYFTFAVNYALEGENVRGYHVVNLAIHLATALALFGLVRRTLRLPKIAPRYRRATDPLAAFIALAWVAHPLTTQSVTYVYQRIESLAALICVLCLYAFVRACAESGVVRRGWAVACAACCFAAAVSKESAVALPLLVILYDRVFLGDRWSDVLRHRYLHYAAFSSWAVTVSLMVAIGSDYGKAGIGDVEGVTPVTYLLSQSGVILRYLRLSFWPTGLCLDYAWPIARHPGEIVPQGVVVLVLLIATGVGLFRGRLWSFPAAAFFLILAPTSSIIPIADLYFENRMYLPLAAVLTLAVCGAFELIVRLSGGRVLEAGGRPQRIGVASAALLLVGALAVGTHLRNRDYVSEVSLWHDSAAKAPHNPRSYHLLGRYYQDRRQRDEARRYYLEAISIDPAYVPTLTRLSILSIEERRFDEAEQHVRSIAGILPDSPIVLVRYGVLRAAQGRSDEAAACFAAVLQREPDNLEALGGMASLMFGAGRTSEAAELYRRLIAADPDDPSPRNMLGSIHVLEGREQDAEAAFRQALALRPWLVEARSNLGATLDRLGRGDEALAELTRAVADDGDYLGARINLGNALARRGRFDEAVAQYREALRIDPSNAQAADHLSQALADQALPNQALPSQTGAVPTPRL
jgi:tetratricopeptide (TPR) repeat protein